MMVFHNCCRLALGKTTVTSLLGMKAETIINNINCFKCSSGVTLLTSHKHHKAVITPQFLIGTLGADILEFRIFLYFRKLV